MAARCRCRVRALRPSGSRVRQGAAAGCARQCPSGGRAGSQYRQSIGRSASPLTRRTTSAVSAANECEGITCFQQVTRNGSDEAERSERSPPGVARNAGDEGLAATGGQVSGEAAPARGSASQPDWPPPPARGSGGRARRPPEPSAGRRCGAHYPPGTLPVLAPKKSSTSGHLACSCCQKLLPSGLLCLFLTQCKAEYKTDARLESGAEAYSREAGASPPGSALQGCRAAFPGGIFAAMMNLHAPKTLCVAGASSQRFRAYP